MALWEWCNIRFGALGRGVSIDRHLRAEGYSWWATEEIADVEVDALVERAGPDCVEMLFTHHAAVFATGFHAVR